MSDALAGAIVMAWLLGVVVLGARLIRGMTLLGSLRRSARPIDAGELGGVPDQIRSALGIVEPPTILVSPRIAGPVAVGVLRPAVILPEGLPRTIGEEALRDILIHECAHIVRRDPMVGLIQRVVELIYWPHPMVHLMNRRLSRTREEACDDIVLSRGDAIAYARTLLMLAHRFMAVSRPREALNLMSPGWKLEDRIAGLLKPARETASRSRSRIVIPGMMLVVITGIAAASVRPAASPPARAEEARDVAQDEPKAAGRLRGRVLSADGQPAAGVTVRAAAARRSDQPAFQADARTGADGSYEIAIPTDRTYMVAVVDKVWASSSLGGIAVNRDGGPTDLPEMHLIKGTAIRGQVTVGPRNQPVENQRVVLRHLGANAVGRVVGGKAGALARTTATLERDARTDGSGRYLFRVGSGLYELESPGGKVVRILVREEAVLTHDFHLGDVTGQGDVAPRIARIPQRGRAGNPEPIWLSGVVRDGTRGDRKPVADALVLVRGDGPDLDREISTDADGRFVLMSEPVPWMLPYVRNREGSMAAFAEMGPRGLVVDLEPAGAVSGRVVDETGRPLKGVRVELRLERGEGPFRPVVRSSTHSDERGHYEFPGLVVDSRCEVSVVVREDPTLGVYSVFQQFPVRDREPIALPDLVVDKGAGLGPVRGEGGKK